MSALYVAILFSLILILLILLSGLNTVLIAFTRKRPKPTLKSSQPSQHELHARAGQAWIASVPHEEWEILSFDNLKLRGTFIPAPKPTDKTILCVHGYHCYGTYEFGSISRWIYEQGYNILLPDDRTHGKSEGKLIGFGNLDSIDCISWCRDIIKRQGPSCKILLYGVSMGSATVLNASASKDLPAQVCGVLGDCGYSSGWDEICLQTKRMYHLPPIPFVPAADLWLRLLAGYSLKDKEPREEIRKTKIPLLIIHGDSDTFVPTSMATEIFENAVCDKRLVLIRGARHAQSYDVDPKTYRESFTDLLLRSGMTK